jgi:predicted nucleic acid-binding protein
METLTAQDLGRVADLVEQYADLGLGATDASVVVLADRHGQRRIATLDCRHFSVVRPATGGSFELIPWLTA